MELNYDVEEYTPAERVAADMINGNLASAKADIRNMGPAEVIDTVFALSYLSNFNLADAAERVRDLVAE